jgi:hypothetical protein
MWTDHGSKHFQSCQPVNQDAKSDVTGDTNTITKSSIGQSMAQIWLAEVQHFLTMKCMTITTADASVDIHNDEFAVHIPFTTRV